MNNQTDWVNELIGNNIKKELLSQNKTIVQLQKHLNRSYMQTTRYLNGTSKTTSEQLKSIAEFLNVSSDKLLGLEK